MDIDEYRVYPAQRGAMKIINLTDDKLRHAVLFFASKERFLTLTKLMKLLYFLDFRHYRETGFAVTGQQYNAWDFGPVPTKVWAELKDKSADYGLSEVVRITAYEGEACNGYRISPAPGAEFDQGFFSRRELRILNEVVEMFRGVNTSEISMASHEPLGPWAKTIRRCGQGCEIQYDLALDGLPDDKKALIAELQELDREAHAVLENA